MRAVRGRQTGFSTTELLVALAIAGIIGAMAIPATTRTLADFRLHGDARNIHNLLGVAKMRAAAKYTRSRVYVDFGTETYFLQAWDKTANAWVNEGPVSTLSTGTDFGFDALATPPPSTQLALQEAPVCRDDGGINAIPNTGCIVFNSRGIPVDGTNGNPDGNGAFYLTDHATGVYAITISMTPLVRLWWAPHDIDNSWVRK